MTTSKSLDCFAAGHNSAAATIMWMHHPAGWNPVVFVCDRKAVTAADVLMAAEFRGEMEAQWERLHRLAQIERMAADFGNPDEADLQVASEQFRYDRDLITAEETESWLNGRAVGIDQFTAYLLRQFWNERLNAPHAVGDNGMESTSLEDQRELLRNELMLSGEFDRMAVAISWRYAARQRRDGNIDQEAITAERQRFLERENRTIRSGVETASFSDQGDWLEEMITLEAAYRLETKDAVSEPELHRALHALRIPLTEVELESMEAESLDAAREVTLCVRLDGSGMREIALSGCYPYRTERVLLEQVEGECHHQILCAAPGDILEPVDRGDGFRIMRLIDRREPRLDDPKIRARVEKAVRIRHFSELAAQFIHWEPQFSPR